MEKEDYYLEKLEINILVYSYRFTLSIKTSFCLSSGFVTVSWSYSYEANTKFMLEGFAVSENILQGFN